MSKQSNPPNTQAELRANLIVYSYASRRAFVCPAETYDDAVTIAKESFQKLKDVERERISFETLHTCPTTKVTKMAEIGPTSWPILVPLIPQYGIITIRVARRRRHFPVPKLRPLSHLVMLKKIVDI